MIKNNKFREKIENGSIVLGARASSFSPPLVEIYGNLGLDFVWLDFEHSGRSAWDSPSLENLARAAELSNIDLLVRIPYTNPPMIRKILDTGVRNLLVPRIDTADEVRRAVEATRFTYEGNPGNRGMASQRSSNYGESDNYANQEDKNVNIGVMIEKKAAVDNIDEILSTPDLGFVFIGTNDLSVQLGHPENTAHPEVQCAIEMIVSKVRDKGIPLGGISHDVALINEKIERGYQIIRIGGEYESAKKTLQKRMNDIDMSTGDSK